MGFSTLLAQGIGVEDTGISTTAANAGYSTDAGSLTGLIGSIIQVALGFVGFIVFAYILYAGFLWMTAGGNEENVAKAKTMIRNAVIGFIIIAAAYSITYFVTSNIGAITAG